MTKKGKMCMINLTEELQGAKQVAIAGHVRPDGDCVGACIGLSLYLREYFPQLQVTVYLGDFQDSFRFLKGTDQVTDDCTGSREYDVFFALDCGDTKRLGDAVRYFDTAKKTVCIDHHVSNGSFADVNYVEPEASSTCELVCQILEEDKITKEMAEALYMGMAHDTGLFTYSCTSSRTMRTAGMLMDKGIDFTDIVDRTYVQKTYLQNQILGRALLESITMLDGKIIFSAIRQKDMAFY